MTIEEVISEVALAHKGQLDKAGDPYILHILRVMLKVAEGSGISDMKIALLHDIVEDTNITLESLTNNWLLPDPVVHAVDLLTHRETDSYEKYILRCMSDHAAREVKIADLEDHLERDAITNVLSDRQRNKYKQALKVLIT